MSTLKLSSEIISKFVDWKGEKNPTPDEIIDAFQQGVEKSKSVEEKLVTDAHVTNLKRTMTISQEVCEKLNEIGLMCYKVFVNASKFGRYDVILAVDKNNFITEKRKEAYKYLRNIKKTENKISYNLFFSLMALGDSLDDKALASDGFVIRYEP